MRILVTGASGYIGQHALAHLRARGHRVDAVSRRAGGPAGATWHEGDLLAPRVPERLLAALRPEVLLHFAWVATPGLYPESPENLAWERVTVDLARTFFAEGGRRFVGAGSCAEYDATAGPCDERETPLRPASRYGRSKLSAGQQVDRLPRASNQQSAWGRIFNVIGGEEHPDRLVPSVVRALRSGQPALCTHGNQLRDFLHVDDVGSAFAALVDSDVTGPVNVASGQPHRVRDVILGLAERLGRADLVQLGARPMNEPSEITASTRRLQAEVGWRPHFGFEEALDDTADFWRMRPFK